MDNGLRVQHVQNGLVVLIDQHHAAAAVPLVSLGEHMGEAVAERGQPFVLPIGSLPHGNPAFEHLVQLTGTGKDTSVEVNVEHRIFRPFLLQTLDCQSLEEVFPPLEIILER